VVTDADRRWEETKMESRELVQELTLLQTRGSELHQAIVGPLMVRGQLSEGMRVTAVHHTEMAE
jgi:hypothetical protein